jgi:hypothetical protein
MKDRDKRESYPDILFASGEDSVPVLSLMMMHAPGRRESMCPGRFLELWRTFNSRQAASLVGRLGRSTATQCRVEGVPRWGSSHIPLVFHYLGRPARQTKCRCDSDLPVRAIIEEIRGSPNAGRASEPPRARVLMERSDGAIALQSFTTQRDADRQHTDHRLSEHQRFAGFPPGWGLFSQHGRSSTVLLKKPHIRFVDHRLERLELG